MTREHGPSLTRTFCTALIGAAAMLSCARGTPQDRPLPDPARDTPAEVAGARPDTPTSVPGARPDADPPVPGAGAQDSVLRISPLPLPPMIGPDDDQPGEAGLSVRLREAPDDTPAVPAPDTPDVAGPSPAGVLSPDRTAQLLARLPALPSPDTAAFRFPTTSPPPPLTGRIVLSPFPPPDTVNAAPIPTRVAMPLRIVRIVPTGATELAPHLTITFSDAMVPLTTVAGTDARTVPVRLSPQPHGRWSWIDTRTLRFQPDGRFPMATSFVVDVPAATRSVAGVPLDDAVRVEFSTPAPRALGAYPALHPENDAEPDRPRPGRGGWNVYYPWSYDHGRSVGLQPVVLIAFDQRVDPAAVVRSARLVADGRSHALRVATSNEIAADSVVSRLIEELEEQRWVAVRPVEPLPGDADVRLALNAGLASAEGPLTTTQSQELRFRTYGALRIASTSCDDNTCRPGQPWAIRLTNDIDEDAWSADFVRVDPALRDMTVDVSGPEVQIRGDTRPNTRYVVTLSPRVRDRFGQTLQEPRSVTIDVGEAYPAITLPGAPFIVLDPDGPRRVAMQSQGYRSLRVSVYRVTPDEWLEYGMAIERSQRSPGEQFAPPGDLVASTNIDASANAAEFSETIINIEPALRDGLGHAIVVVTSTDDVPTDQVGSRSRNLAHAWVQSTRIGLTGTVDAANLFVWASTLDAARPLADVQLRVLPTNRSAVTARDGTAQIPLTTPGDAALIAILGADTALLPAETYGGSGRPWERRPTDELRWHLLTDRGLYLPGDTVHLKGWLRRTEGSGAAELSLARGVSGIDFTMRGPRNEDVGSGAMRPGELGGFHTAIALPTAINLGHAGIELRATGADVPESGIQAWHSVQVQEFRRPEYEVRVEADPGPYVIGDVIDVMLNADYYGGGGLAGASREWRILPGPGQYTPPGWERWHFGRTPWLPWIGSRSPPETLSGVTNAAGAHRVFIDLLAVDPPFTTTLRAEAQVHDVTRQIGSAGVSLLVHPAAVNVGIRMERGWLHPGQEADLDIIVVDHEGRPAAGLGVDVVIERLRDGWWMRDRAPETGSERTVCRVESGATPLSCRFAVDTAGTYRIRADVRDIDGRISRSELTLWVAGAPGVPDPRREPGSFEMIADREEYQPGDTARILVQPPFHPAEAFVTVRSAGVIATQRLRIDSASYELKLPITEDHIPNIRVRVELVDAERGVNFAFGEARISVPPHRRALDVHVQPRDTLATPGGEVTIDVEVRDADGNAAAGAEVALWMVDEAILALGNYTLTDPLTSFYAARYGYVMDQHSRQWVVHWPQSAGPGTLSGLVVDGDMGRALAGAIVRLVGTDIETRSAYDGSFTLRDVPPGEHVIEITAPNGTTGRRTVTVPAAGAHVGNLVLGASGLDGARVVGQAGAAENRLQSAPVAVAPPPPPPAPGMDANLKREALIVTGAGGAQQEVELRTDFAPLAFFEPALRTDAGGRVQVTAQLPGSLTRYRIMAVAVAGAQHFGTGDAAVTARRDLMVRIAAPRFLNYGDRFELPVLVQNVTSRAMNVDVAARSSGMNITGASGRTLTLGPGARAEVRFAGAAGLPGNAHMQVIASASNAADVEAATDAAALTIPVYTPGTVEAFATYGTIDSDAPVVLPLERPADVIDAFGGLEVSITSTALHSLTDAVLYLHRYPFEGSEHIASRIMSIAALRDVLTAFGAEGLPSPDTLVANVQRDIAELSARQGEDGGWSFWRGGLPSHPFVTIHVAHALQRAQENGFDVPPAALQRAAEYLRTIDTHVARWPLKVRQSAAAYALYVRHRIGDPSAISEARRLASAAPERVGGELPIEAAGWLLHVLAADPASSELVDILERTLLNRLVETAGTVTFAERYEDGEHLLLHSRRRTDAVVLDALIAASADTDVITRLAQSLLAHRTAGRWSGTQENAWVLLALDRYFRTFEATTPAFASRVWLDDRFAGTHAFEGRTTERQHIDIPMPELLRSDPDELIIAREGAGRMYYRAGVRYAPADPRTPAADRGFVVSRTYEAVDDTADVTRDADGTWHVRAGARVRVRLTMIAPSVRHHAALVDPLPAGFEPLNPGLSGTGFTDDPDADIAAARDARPGPFGTWRPTWFDHQNLRDDRAEAFAALLPAGAYDYTYLVRATTPGTFIVPPARAEMMYQPETFGRGAGNVVVVE